MTFNLCDVKHLLEKPEFPAPPLPASKLLIHWLLATLQPPLHLTGNYAALHSRLLLPPGDGQRLLVRPGPVRAAPEVRELSGIHRAAHPGQQEGGHEECWQRSGHQRHREEAGALLRFNAHKEAVFPAEKVAESDLGCKVCWFNLTALETMSTSGIVRIHWFSFFWSVLFSDTKKIHTFVSE